MASTGNIFPGTGANVDRSGLDAWTNPGNIVSNNTTDATCLATSGSDYLVASNFGFTIPTSCLITGVTVRVEASEHSTGTEGLNAQLQNDTSTLIGSSKSNTISGTAKAVYTYGATNDSWSATLTPDIVNSANFGVRLWFTTAHDVRVDFVTVAIEYSDPTSGVVRENIAFGSRSPGYGVLSGGGIAPNLPLGLRGKVGPPMPGGIGITNLRKTLTAFDLSRGGALGDTSGTLSVTEADDTSAISVQAISTGTLAVSEDADTSAIVGRTIATGTLSRTEEDDTLAASAALPLVSGAPSYGIVSGQGIAPNLPLGARGGLGRPSPGNKGITVFRPSLRFFDLAQGQQNERTSTLAVTEADDTSAITGQAISTGTLAVTEASDTCAAGGLSDQVGNGSPGAPSYGLVSGGGISPNLPLGLRTKVGRPYPGSVGISTLHSTLGRIALLESLGIATRLDVIEQDDTLATSGTVRVLGTAAIAESEDTLAASSGTSGSIGTAAIVEGDDTSDISLYQPGTETSLPSYGVRSGGGVVHRFGLAPTVGILSTGGPIGLTVRRPTLISGLVFSIAGVSASVIVTEADDTVASSGTVLVQGDVDLSESDDTLATTTTVRVLGTLAASEEADTCSAASANERVGTLSRTEADDTLDASAFLMYTGSVSVTEANDTGEASGTVIPSCIVDITEAGDTVAASGSVSITGSLSVTEGNDGLNVPLVSEDSPRKEAGKSKRRRRYILPDGSHVYATEQEAQEFAGELLDQEVRVVLDKPKKKLKPPTLELNLPSIAPVTRQKKSAVEDAWIAFTQQAPIDAITVEKLRETIRRRRRIVALLLAA